MVMRDHDALFEDASEDVLDGEIWKRKLDIGAKVGPDGPRGHVGKVRLVAKRTCYIWYTTKFFSSNRYRSRRQYPMTKLVLA